MNQYLVRPGKKVDLDDFDTDDTSLLPGGKTEAKVQLAAIVERLAEIQELLFAGHERRLLIVLQGMDTSGQGRDHPACHARLQPTGDPGSVLPKAF